MNNITNQLPPVFIVGKGCYVKFKLFSKMDTDVFLAGKVACIDREEARLQLTNAAYTSATVNVQPYEVVFPAFYNIQVLEYGIQQTEAQNAYTTKAVLQYESHRFTVVAINTKSEFPGLPMYGFNRRVDIFAPLSTRMFQD